MLFVGRHRKPAAMYGFFFICLSFVNSQLHQGILFNNVYDARQVLLAKNAMEKYNTLELKKKDLVLLEARLTRYRQKDNNGRWSIHRAQFELQAISILQNAPDDSSATNEDSDIDIEDLSI